MINVKTFKNTEVTRIAWRSASFDAGIASVRIRCIQVIDELNKLGVRAGVFELTKANDYRTVVFSKSYSDEDIKLAENLSNSGVRIIFDICDNHIYFNASTSALEYRVKRLERMINCADDIVCSTPTLATQLIEKWPLSSNKIHVIPDMLDNISLLRMSQGFIESFFHCSNKIRLKYFFNSNPSQIRLIWFGSHGVSHASSGMADLLLIKKYLEEINKSYPITLTIISNSYRKYLKTFKGWSLPVLYIPWEVHTFDDFFRRHHVAIFPISRNPFTIAKSINRPCTAIMSGLGVIADSIPSYEELRPFIWLDNWREALESYCSDIDTQMLRIKDASKFIQDKYSGHEIAKKWAQLLLKSSN